MNVLGPVSFSTEADLIAPGVCLHGVFSVTPDEFFFEVSEQHPSFTQADPKVSRWLGSLEKAILPGAFCLALLSTVFSLLKSI